MGVGLTKRISAVRWGITRSLLVAWILTIPVSMLLAASIYWIFELLNFDSTPITLFPSTD
jgi:PiT family inorganic phosphate transporter